ncbi:MAG: VWA domain-containing protein, partial [Clostridiales Family XIII bacterium]|nr:VWA domain-containing protein [Clostridiales Family XIII bacterium]
MKITGKIFALPMCVMMIASALLLCAPIVNAEPQTTITVDSKERDVVLVIDTSGSMSGGWYSSSDSPMEYAKTAALNFVTKTFDKTSNTRIALVTLNTASTTECGLTKNKPELETAINSLYAHGGTNIDDALKTADSILAGSAAPVKAIVLMSDGLPEDGSSYVGDDAQYASTEYGAQASYASAVYRTAVPMKTTYDVYTLGFFHSLTDTELKLGRQLLTDIASDPKNYYDVVDPDKLDFAFGEIIEEIIEETEPPIIIIPGIMGSRLFGKIGFGWNSQVWPPYALPDDTLGQIWYVGSKAITNGLDLFDVYKSLGDAVKASNTLYIRPMQNQQDLQKDDSGDWEKNSQSREYGALGTYKNLTDKLCEAFPGREIYFFSYDFREDIAVTAQKLQNEIDSLAVDYVDLVCHSMGGLVAEQYYSQNESSH